MSRFRQIGAVGLVIGLLLGAGENAYGDPPSEAPDRKLTPEQQEKLKTRDQLGKTANQADSEGKLAEARTAVEKKLAIERDVFGHPHINTVNSLAWLTDLCLRDEDYPSARDYGRQTLVACTHIHGDSHWKTTDSRLAIAEVELHAKLTKDQRADLKEATRLRSEGQRMLAQGEQQKCQQHAEKALVLLRAVLGEEDTSYAICLNEVGYACTLQGNFEKAEPLNEQALKIQKKVLGENHPNYAASLFFMGFVYQQQGQLAKCEPFYKEALETQKAAHGEKHRNYAASLHNLAHLYVQQGRFSKAEPLYTEALAIHRVLLGRKHPVCLTGLHNLAILYRSQDLYAKAEPLFLEAIALRKEVLGAKHPEYADDEEETTIVAPGTSQPTARSDSNGIAPCVGAGVGTGANGFCGTNSVRPTSMASSSVKQLAITKSLTVLLVTCAMPNNVSPSCTV